MRSCISKWPACPPQLQTDPVVTSKTVTKQGPIEGGPVTIVVVPVIYLRLLSYRQSKKIISVSGVHRKFRFVFVLPENEKVPVNMMRVSTCFYLPPYLTSWKRDELSFTRSRFFKDNQPPPPVLVNALFQIRLHLPRLYIPHRISFLNRCFRRDHKISEEATQQGRSKA